MSQKKIAVLIPAYNEEITVRDTILGFHRELPDAEFIIVDNNSTDQTRAIAETTLRKNQIKGKVLFEGRQGKANAIRKGFSRSDADLFVMVDADLTYPPEEVHKLLETLERQDADMVVGDRLSLGHYEKENKRSFHSEGNRIVIQLINTFFGVQLKDAMSGYRILTRRFVRNYPILSSGFELEIDLTLHALDKRFAFAEIPIAYRDRPAGSFSKLNTFRDGYRVIKNILLIFKDYRPMQFFGSISLAAFLGSWTAGVPAILDYVQYKYVYHVPLAILATGLMTVSLISLTVGLILHTITRIQRFNFELRLLQGSEVRSLFADPAESFLPEPVRRLSVDANQR